MFELSGVNYEEVLAQGDSILVRVIASSIYRGFELSGLYCTCNMPNPEEVAILKARNEMRIQAETSMDSSQNIIGTNVQHLSQAAKERMPSLETVRRGIRRAKQGNVPVAPQPNDRTFAIPASYTTMENGDRFLRFDNNVDNRILIFGTGESLNFLASADAWFMDGTFTVAPPQFAQMHTIHGLSGDHHIIGCYALLPNKTRETYVELLQQVNHLTNGFEAQSIMIDYEQACISAIPDVYPNTSVFGCLFHLSQSIFRNV